MSQTNDGGPRYPTYDPTRPAPHKLWPGESRRWHAAVAAMQSLLDPNSDTSDHDCLEVARKAFRLADALLIVEQEAR